MAIGAKHIYHYVPQPYPRPAYCGMRRINFGVPTLAEFKHEQASGTQMCQRCADKIAAREEREARRAPSRDPGARRSLSKPAKGDRFDDFGLVWIVDKVSRDGRTISVHRESRDAFGRLSVDAYRTFHPRDLAHMKIAGPDRYHERDRSRRRGR